MATVTQDRPGAGRHRTHALGGDLSIKSFQVKMSDKYPTGGEELGLGTYFTTEVLGVAIGGDASGYVFAYDKGNDKLIAYYGDYSEASDGPLVEVEADTDLSSITVPILVWGR